MRILIAILALSFIALGCGTLPALSAVQDGRIALKATEQDVFAAAGAPDLILARRGVETFYYKRSETLAVSVSLLKGKVIAFDDSDKWPIEAAKASDAADSPVATGKVRVGMNEDLLFKTLDEPDGLTAKGGEETFHWLTGDEVDSLVTVKGGKVVGFWDRPVSEFTQNLPTADRDNATTSGKIRVGMTMADVEKLLGAPTGKAGKKGVTIHRYESDPVFGDTIIYSVGFKDDKVVDLSEYNATREEDKKEEEEAQRLAAEAEKRGEEAESSIFSFLNNPLVKTALSVAGGALVQGAAGGSSSSSSTTSSVIQNTLDINGQQYTGSLQPCGDGVGCPSGESCHVMAGTTGQCVK